MPTPDVTVTAQSATSIRVEIEMMEALRYSASITGYKIRFTKYGATRITYTATITSHTFSHTFNALEPYTFYSVQASVVISGVTAEAWSSIQYVRSHEDSE